MVRLGIIALALLLAAASTALASDPKKTINPADQARARAMLLKQADVGLGFSPAQSSGGSSGVEPDCPALDESDLTITGEADSKFTSGIHTIGSAASVYASVRDANTSWRRGTGTAGLECLKKGFQQVSRATHLRFVSFRRVHFPRVAPSTVAFRWQALVGGVRVYADFVFLMRGRAQVAEFFVAALDPFDRDEQLRLTRLVSNRMTKAMRAS
jgi:hypothetical protein